MPISPDAVDDLFREFSARAARKLKGSGEPEANLRSPLEELITGFGTLANMEVVLSDEDLLSDLSVKPDWSVVVDGATCGHVEVKRPGKGADPQAFTDEHDKAQWERLRALPNVLYSDGNEFAVYRDGERAGESVAMASDIRQGATVPVDTNAATGLMHDFLSWHPVPPRNLSELASRSARLCRLLRAEVSDALAEGSGPLEDLADDWRDLLFPDASDEVFADQYAQTVTFGLLLARAEQIDLESGPLFQVARDLGGRHALLGRALEVLTDQKLLGQLGTSMGALQRTLAVVEWDNLTGTSEYGSGATGSPWLHFYEDFLAEYDPELRKATGSYYTPDQVVDCTVRLIDEALRTQLSKSAGFASEGVTVVDPATGTGTYLLHVAELTARTARGRVGKQAEPQALRDLASRLIGFEKQTGPYAVAQLRLWKTLTDHGADLGPDDLRLYVTDTLANPYEEQRKLGGFYEPIAESRRRANRVKADERVLVVLGNPPYKDKSKGQGGWVEEGEGAAGEAAPLDDFRAPADWGLGGQERVLSNLYVYFWRWAIWKAFEAHDDSTHGVVAFITSSAWLTADGLTGMRHYMRNICDRLYVIDLGGESRGGRKEPNIFNIQTPVAITVAVRDGSRTGEPAEVRYRRIRHVEEPPEGVTQAHTKLNQLDGISLSDSGWTVVEGEPREMIGAGVTSEWKSNPELTEILPWTTPGIKPNRTWVYAPEPDTLRRRWNLLVNEDDEDKRRKKFKPSRDAQPDETYEPLPGFEYQSKTMMKEDGPCPNPVKVGYRSFDVQWLIPDRRVIHDPSVNVWRVRSERQIYVGWNPVPGRGPALTFSAHPPDMPFFQGNANANGRVIPFWRDAAASEANVAPGLLKHLSDELDTPVSAPELLAYLAAIASHDGYTNRFWSELETPGVRIPVTSESALFARAVELGSEVVWLHTYGERFHNPKAGRPASPPRLPDDQAPEMIVAIPDTAAAMPDEIRYVSDTSTLTVGEGRISPVSQEVWDYEVSGMNVIRKWFSYRRRKPGGRKSSPLDKVVPEKWTWQRTQDLMDLLHVLGRVVALEPRQAELLDAILDGPLVTTAALADAEIFPVPKSATQPPDPDVGQQSLGV